MSAKRIKIRKKKEGRAQVVGQWIEVTVKDGVTSSTRYPDDAEVRKLISEKEEETGRKVDLVYRRLHFVNGVPPEYEWTTDDARRMKYGGMAIQRLCVEDWMELCGKENGGHLRSSARHMPRPESRGGCDCDACRAQTERLAKFGR